MAESRIISSSNCFRGTYARKLATVAMVAITLCAIGLPILIQANESEGYSGDQYTVVYHLSDDDGNLLDSDGNTQTGFTINTSYNTDTKTNSGYSGVTCEKTYYGGFVSTEYNPQVWNEDTDNDRDADRWFEILDAGYSTDAEVEKAGQNATTVFTGWVYRSGDGYSDWRYPGEVMSQTEMRDATSDGKIHIYATWGKLLNYRDDLTEVGEDLTHYEWWQVQWVVDNAWTDDGNEFTNIVRIDGRPNLEDIGYGGGITIR